MKHKITITIAGLLAAIVIFCGCYSPKKITNTGVVVYKHKVKYPGSVTFIKMEYIRDAKVWYKDNFVIEERSAFTSEKDIYGKETTNEYVDHYSFINLNTREYYDYKNFSDTALPLRSFSDSATITSNGGNNFWGIKNTTFKTGGVLISDTTFDGVTYKRVWKDSLYGVGTGQPFKTHHIAYLRCDLKGMPISIETKLSERIGCPVVRSYYNSLNGGMDFVSELDKIADTLSAKELKVFLAWEKYAKEHPVIK